MPKGTYLGDFEQLVMLALLRLGEGAYGMTVRRELEETADRRVSLGAIYATLDRLEGKGLVTSFLGAPGNARRGRAKRFFRVRGPGVRALQASLAALDRMRKGIESLDRMVGVTA
jgi:PadR family transcriptional regulator PadR